MNYFNVLCATRVGDEWSKNLFDSVIAGPTGGVRKYGELVYRYRDNVSKVRVPFCDCHD